LQSCGEMDADRSSVRSRLAPCRAHPVNAYGGCFFSTAPQRVEAFFLLISKICKLSSDTSETLP
jgi:hypothetical protein